jgi:nucleoside 2-deoxyribosyltransferase
MDYSDIKDFRNKKELSRQIVNHDLEYLKKADVLVVLANMPSYGAAIEMFVAKNSGKKIVLLAKDPVPTPWSINFSDYVVTTEEELIKLLWDLKKGVTY